ncbi:hypothetical protein N7533_002436 [Penicillium manginii]|uniref:uncharacterized protein n=1 Tax=Penicillium manginii TaxID=203109 RepID=UPI0025476735|nr:uncharacterized protein N7533_002436 [Penicillium manginii]KAJ5763755.1 hypothetical protein N7533_002436 [Penicillium manginii]
MLIGPGNSEILMPAQLDISPSADMIFPRMPPLGLSVLDQNTPIHREMIVQAMPVDVAPAVHIPIHREMILEDISRYGFAALETSIQQDYVGHLVSNFPNIQDNTVPETTSVAYCRNNPGSRGNTNSCEALRVQPNAEELRCCWQGCTEIRIFSCEATLLRHVKTIHIAPKSKKCPICGYTNGRKDKVRSHFRLVHKR